MPKRLRENFGIPSAAEIEFIEASGAILIVKKGFFASPCEIPRHRETQGASG